MARAPVSVGPRRECGDFFSVDLRDVYVSSSAESAFKQSSRPYHLKYTALGRPKLGPRLALLTSSLYSDMAIGKRSQVSLRVVGRYLPGLPGWVGCEEKRRGLNAARFGPLVEGTA